MSTKRIAVVGSGIAGITAAYYLARQGHFVTVFDQERYPAMRTSYANGGQISVSNSEVWTTWNNLYKGARWILKKDAPLLIRPDLDLNKAIWLLKFLWHTANNVYEKNTIETIKMGLDARRRFKNIIEREDIQFDQSTCGILHFYKDYSYLDASGKTGDLYRHNGCEWHTLNEYEILDIEPTLGHAPGILGGAWTPSDWTGDIHKFCVELARVMDEKYNVDFVFGTEITDINKDLDLYDDVVIAAGVGSVRLAKKIGDRLPIYPVKGYSITVHLDEASKVYAPTVSLLDDQAKIVTARLGDRLRIAGTAELAGENYDIRRDRIEPLLRWVRENFPHINTSNYSSWACLRPMTPNMMPIVCRSKRKPNVWYHTGHGHLGWTLSPNTANALAKMIHES